MEVTREQVLESMNAYCTERKYGSDSLTEVFKGKFADIFTKKYEGKDVDESVVNEDLHFTLDTAFNASRGVISSMSAQFATKENDYKKQIDELKKNVEQKTPVELSPEIKAKLEEYDKFVNGANKEKKFAEIIALAKKDIREDLHDSFDAFAKTQQVNLEETNEAQAKSWHEQFQTVFKGSIGDIRPKKPQQVKEDDSEYIANIPKVKV